MNYPVDSGVPEAMECGMNLFECLDHNILNPKDLTEVYYNNLIMYSYLNMLFVQCVNYIQKTNIRCWCVLASLI